MSLSELQSILVSRRTELNKLRKERSKIQRELDRLDRQISSIEGGRTGGGRARNAKSLNDTIEEVLRAHGKPMKVGQILDAVRAAGYRSGSANFRGIINQTLIKDDRFTAPERGVYQLKK